MKIEFKNNKNQTMQITREAALRALERIGLQAEGYAIDLVPADTGDLRNSITHQVDESNLEVYIGTNKKYGVYVEFGTGLYYPGGRKEPWAYKDGKGQWHFTHGQKAQPWLKPAIVDHLQTYKNIIDDEMRGK